MMCRKAARVAVLATSMAILWSLSSQAQTVHGTPPSVTSLGFGGTGNTPHGLPPSVTSLGFGHVGTVTPTQPHHHNPGRGHGAVYYFPYAYPYAVDGPPSDASDDVSDDEYQGGPTIFDRRGHGAAVSASDSSRDSLVATEAPPTSVAAPDSAPQPQTVLVFKDGHEVEIANYAIVGSTLYDLSQDRRWKIALSELDLPATVKQNDDRGLDFQVPTSSPQAN